MGSHVALPLAKDVSPKQLSNTPTPRAHHGHLGGRCVHRQHHTHLELSRGIVAPTSSEPPSCMMTSKVCTRGFKSSNSCTRTAASADVSSLLKPSRERDGQSVYIAEDSYIYSKAIHACLYCHKSDCFPGCHCTSTALVVDVEVSGWKNGDRRV